MIVDIYNNYLIEDLFSFNINRFGKVQIRKIKQGWHAI